MQHKNVFFFMVACSAAFIITSCQKTDSNLQKPATPTTTESMDKLVSENGTNPDELVLQNAVASSTSSYLYTESNAATGNTIIGFTQKSDGSLINRNEYASGGYGSGAGLGAQGALCTSRDMGLLFAVNAGSGTISSFRIHPNGSLQLLFTLPSQGLLPRSLTIYGNVLFVLNEGNSAICGFTVSSNGFFSKIEGSEHSLSALNVDAPQISFQPDGKALYVTEKATNLIDKFTLDNTSAVISATYTPSSGVTPFGFDFSLRAKAMIVTNAANGSSGAGSCTSYKNNGGEPKAVNGAVGNFETSPCWLATAKYGSFAFVSNTSTNNISSYYVDKNGAITLLKAVAGADGTKPIDIVVSEDNRYVYNVNSGSHTISEYKRMPAGAIELIGAATTLPEFSTGLVCY